MVSPARQFLSLPRTRTESEEPRGIDDSVADKVVGPNVVVKILNSADSYADASPRLISSRTKNVPPVDAETVEKTSIADVNSPSVSRPSAVTPVV